MSTEKSFYEKMKERHAEDAKNLGATPKEIGQHILWLKGAIIERIETVDTRLDDKVYTFRAHAGKEISITEASKLTDPYKFGFSENYVNLMLHFAYEAGKKRATEDLTRNFNESTRSMRDALDKIVSALDDNDLLPNTDNSY